MNQTKHRKKKYCLISLTCGIYLEVESRTVVTRGREGGLILVKGYKVAVM